MKIAFLRADYHSGIVQGGTATVHLGQINSFIEEGHECIYITCGENYLPDEVKYFRIDYLEYLLNIPEVYNLKFSDKFAKLASKILLKEKPDLIIQQHSAFNFSAALIKSRTKIPYVLHCDGVEYWAKKFWGGKLFLPHLLRLSEKVQWKYADIINTPSQYVADMLIQYGAPKNKIIRNINGVNLRLFNPDNFDWSIKKRYQLDDLFIIGYVGTFSSWHGTDILAKAINILKKRMNNFIVLFVGDGYHRAQVESIILNDDNINFARITGLIDYKEIPYYIKSFDIVATPCINNDDSPFFNSPVKLFEYMAMGKPIVATDVGQQSEVIQHGINGLLCEEKSPEALAEAIMRFYEDKELAEKCGRQARKDAIEKYDWRMYNKRIIDAYENLVKGRSSR